MELGGASPTTGATGTTSHRCRRSKVVAAAAEARLSFFRSSPHSPSSLLHIRDMTILPLCSPCARCSTTTSAKTRSSILQQALRSPHSASSQTAQRAVFVQAAPGAVVLISRPSPSTTRRPSVCSFCEGSQPSLMHSFLEPKCQYMRAWGPGGWTT
jgi:hypothetical protein